MISVIIPVYNSEKTLVKCLRSLLGQSFVDYELIIVNDGSTDGTESLCMRYANKYYKKIKYFQKENGGVSSARNMGIKNAKGDYICFVDSDDYVAPNYLEDLYNGIKENDADLSMCLISKSWDMVSSDETFFYNCNEIIKTILINTYHNAGPYNKLFKRELMRGLRFAEDVYLGEDTLFCVEYAKKCRNAVRINKVLYYYEIPTSSTLYVKDKTKLHRNLSVIESRKRMMVDIMKFDEEVKELIKTSFVRACSYNATLGVSYNNLNMIRYVAQELLWAKKTISLHLNNRQNLLLSSTLLYYIICKCQQKVDSFFFYISKLR